MSRQAYDEVTDSYYLPPSGGSLPSRENVSRVRRSGAGDVVQNYMSDLTAANNQQPSRRSYSVTANPSQGRRSVHSRDQELSDDQSVSQSPSDDEQPYEYLTDDNQSSASQANVNSPSQQYAGNDNNRSYRAQNRLMRSFRSRPSTRSNARQNQNAGERNYDMESENYVSQSSLESGSLNSNEDGESNMSDATRSGESSHFDSRSEASTYSRDSQQSSDRPSDDHNSENSDFDDSEQFDDSQESEATHRASEDEDTQMSDEASDGDEETGNAGGSESRQRSNSRGDGARKFAPQDKSRAASGSRGRTGLEKSGNNRSAAESRQRRNADHLQKSDSSRRKSAMSDISRADSEMNVSQAAPSVVSISIEGSSKFTGDRRQSKNPSSNVLRQRETEKKKRLSQQKRDSVQIETATSSFCKFLDVFVDIVSSVFYTVLAAIVIITINRWHTFMEDPAKNDMMDFPYFNENSVDLDEYELIIKSDYQTIAYTLQNLASLDAPIVDYRFLLTPGLTEELATAVSASSKFIFPEDEREKLLVTSAFFNPLIDQPRSGIRFHDSDIVVEASAIDYWCEPHNVDALLRNHVATSIEKLHVVLKFDFNENKNCLTFANDNTETLIAIYWVKPLPDGYQKRVLAKNVTGGSHHVIVQKLTIGGYEKFMGFTKYNTVPVAVLNELVQPGFWRNETLTNDLIEDSVVCWLGVYLGKGGLPNLSSLPDNICPESTGLVAKDSDLSGEQAKIHVGLRVMKSGNSCFVLHEPEKWEPGTVRNHVSYWFPADEKLTRK